MENQNIKRNENYNQVCVWPGTIVGKDKIEEFQNFFKDNFNIRVQYLEEIKTKMDKSDTSGETGGRNDIFFAINNEDISRFAILRLSLGIRWIEDILSKLNGYDQNPIYPKRIHEYKTW